MGRFWLLLLVFIAIVGIACTGGAQAQDISETSSPIPAQVQREPMLTEAEAIGLAYTKLLSELKIPNPLAPSCLDVKESATYKDSGNWVVRHGDCTFVIDDRTGKVTGP